VRQHVQEMDEAVMRQHIDLYVNDFSRGMGAAGKAAIEHMLQVMGHTTLTNGLFIG
jgi:1,4-dihydroxy-6-naphthoate synthase